MAPRPGARVDPDEVVELCRRELAGYKKPRRVVFVDEIPRNPSGKVLKRVLREQFKSIRHTIVMLSVCAPAR